MVCTRGRRTSRSTGRRTPTSPSLGEALMSGLLVHLALEQEDGRGSGSKGGRARVPVRLLEVRSASGHRSG